VQHIQESLASDPILFEVMSRIPLRPAQPNPDVYFTLLKSIVEQQLSLKAADTIWNRFLDKFEDYPHPQDVVEIETELMRSCGLSFQKAGYMQNIARFAIENDLSDAFIASLDDEAAEKHLCQIKGVGKWTAEMILMFSLGREDVFPVGDLAVRAAMIKLYDVKSEKKQLFVDLESIADQWRPYRSYGTRLMWDWYLSR
jgi:DNA-3-methyladenine glycosylase II